MAYDKPYHKAVDNNSAQLHTLLHGPFLIVLFHVGNFGRVAAFFFFLFVCLSFALFWSTFIQCSWDSVFLDAALILLLNSSRKKRMWCETWPLNSFLIPRFPKNFPFLISKQIFNISINFRFQHIHYFSIVERACFSSRCWWCGFPWPIGIDMAVVLLEPRFLSASDSFT